MTEQERQELELLRALWNALKGEPIFSIVAFELNDVDYRDAWGAFHKAYHDVYHHYQQAETDAAQMRLWED